MDVDIVDLVRDLDITDDSIKYASDFDHVAAFGLRETVTRLSKTNLKLSTKFYKFVATSPESSGVSEVLVEGSDALYKRDEAFLQGEEIDNSLVFSDKVIESMKPLMVAMSKEFEPEEMVEILEAGTQSFDDSFYGLRMHLAPVLDDDIGDGEYEPEEDEEDGYMDDELIDDDERLIGNEGEYVNGLPGIVDEKRGMQDITEIYDDYQRRLQTAESYAKPVSLPLTTEQTEVIESLVPAAREGVLKPVIDYRMYVAWLGEDFFPTFDEVLNRPIGSNLGDGVRVLHAFLQALLDQLRSVM
jgi:hypothetical protein